MAKITVNLSRILEQKNLSVDDASKVTKISRPTIYALRDGKAAGIQFETLEKLCAGLEVKPCDIFKIESQAKSKQP